MLSYRNSRKIRIIIWLLLLFILIKLYSIICFIISAVVPNFILYIVIIYSAIKFIIFLYCQILIFIKFCTNLLIEACFLFGKWMYKILFKRKVDQMYLE